MIKLDENKNPYLPNKDMIRFIKKNINIISNYPNIDVNKINKKISQVLDIDESCLTFTNGTMDGFFVLLKTLKSTNCGIIYPTFWGFEHVASSCGKKINKYKASDNKQQNLNNLNKLAKKCDMIYICNPNNPTLEYFDSSELISLISNNPDCHFIIDETLLAYEQSFFSNSLYKQVAEFNNLSVLLSLSKILGIAGLRAGIIFANPTLITAIKQNISPFSVNIFTEKFILNFIDILNNLDSIKQKIYQNYTYLENNICKQYIEKIINRNSCFMLIKLHNHINIIDIKNYFTEHKIILRYSDELLNFEGNWLRISAGTKKQYVQLIKVFNKYCKSIK